MNEIPRTMGQRPLKSVDFSLYQLPLQRVSYVIQKTQLYGARSLVLVFSFQVGMLRSSLGFRKVEQVQNKTDDLSTEEQLDRLVCTQSSDSTLCLSINSTYTMCLFTPETENLTAACIARVYTQSEGFYIDLCLFQGLKPENTLTNQIWSLNHSYCGPLPPGQLGQGRGNSKQPSFQHAHPNYLPSHQPPRVGSCDHRRRWRVWP